MVRNLLSLKCQRARDRQFVCPALPVPEGHRVTSVTCHGHQLPTVSPVWLGGSAEGVSYTPALPCCPWGSCTEQMSLPQPWTQGCWSLRLDGDLVADASCLESPRMDAAVPPCRAALPGVAAPRWPGQGCGGCSLPALWHRAQNATSAARSHCLGQHGEFGDFLQK